VDKELKKNKKEGWMKEERRIKREKEERN